MKAVYSLAGGIFIVTLTGIFFLLSLEARNQAKSVRPCTDICSGVDSKCIIVDEDFLKYIKASTKWKKFMETHERDVFMGFGIYPKDAGEDSK